MNGSRVPIVFLHGFLGRASMFDALVRRFGPLATAIDLPGHGPGSPNTAPATHRARRAAPALARAAAPTDAWDAAIDAIAGCLSRRPSLLVGYSMGARVALGIAAAQPALVAGLVLAGVNPGLSTAAERATRRAEDEANATRLERGGMEAFAAWWEALPLFNSQRSLTDDVRLAQAKARRSHDAAAVARSLRTLGLGAMPDLRAALVGLASGSTAIPVTLVAGELDAKFRSIAETLEGSATKVDVILAAGSGHNVVLEAPEAFADIVAGTWARATPAQRPGSDARTDARSEEHAS